MKQVTIFLLGGAYYDGDVLTITYMPWHYIRKVDMFKDVGFRVTRLIKNKSI